MRMASVSLVCVCVLGLFLIIAGCTQSQPAASGSIPASMESRQQLYTSNETLVAFVDSAAAYVKTHGAGKALAEFNNPNGSFIQGELYVYAYGFNGTTLAHPVNPEAVGKNREGAIGVFVKEMGNAVRDGSGFYRFTYINPEHNRTLEAKMGYGVKIDEHWWLGSGVYRGPVETSGSPQKNTTDPQGTYTSNETLVAFVDSAVDYAQTHGREKALAEFNNPKGSFVQGELYIYAYDFNSTTLAHPFSPEKIGLSRIDEPDAFGNPYAYKFIDAARNGSGFVRFYYLNPVHNRTIESKLGYVKKVNEDWWLGSGVYTGPVDPTSPPAATLPRKETGQS